MKEIERKVKKKKRNYINLKEFQTQISSFQGKNRRKVGINLIKLRPTPNSSRPTT